MSYSVKKSKIIKDWMKEHPNIVLDYEIVDTKIERKSGRYEHKVVLSEDYHVNNRKIVQDVSANSLLWSLNYLMEEE